MKDIALTARGTTVRVFSSYCQLFVYVIDLFIRGSLLFLVVGAGLLQEVIDSSQVQLDVYAGIYLVTIVVWGLLLIKFILGGKGIFVKTRFDMYFIGLLFFSLLSVLFSDDKTRGILGANGTWSLSILTYMCISVLYYAAVLLFRYVRGIKWMILGYVFSLLVPGVYYIQRILDDKTSASLDYMMYIVITIPLIVSSIFLFRKLGLKILAFVGLLLNLFLTSYYSNFLGSGIFLLSVGVLSLFVLFYFSFWVKSSNRLVVFIKDLGQAIKERKKIIPVLKGRSTDIAVLIMIFLMAGWIIGFASFTLQYYNENIGPYLFDWIKTDVNQIRGIGMLLFGSNHLAYPASSMEWINVLINYGLVGLFFMLLLMGRLIYGSAQLTLQFLYKSNWKNIVLSAGLFVMSVSLITSFILIRFTPFLLILFVLLLSIYTIVKDLIKKNDLYTLIDCHHSLIKNKYLKSILVLIVLGLMFYSLYGVLVGVDEGVFFAN